MRGSPSPFVFRFQLRDQITQKGNDVFGAFVPPLSSMGCDAPANTVTVLWSRVKSRSTCNGPTGCRASFSAIQCRKPGELALQINIGGPGDSADVGDDEIQRRDTRVATLPTVSGNLIATINIQFFGDEGR